MVSKNIFIYISIDQLIMSNNIIHLKLSKQKIDLEALSEEAPGLTRDINEHVSKYNIDQFTIVTVDGKKVSFNFSYNYYLFLF